MCMSPGQVLFLVQVLEEGRFTDELRLLTHLLTRMSRLGQFDLQDAEGGPHDLTVTEVLPTHKQASVYSGDSRSSSSRDVRIIKLQLNNPSFTWFSMKALTLCSIPSQVNS